jgi:hypothetical protein
MRSESSVRGRFVLPLSALILTLLFCGSTFGQSTSSVKGTIKDPQGSVVAGATVVLTNPETNVSRTTTSNDSGQFSFEGIQPGTFRIDVESQGFKKAVLNDVRALVAKSTDLEIAMEIGAVTETISVTVGAGEVLANTQDGSLGNNFVSQQITQLPLNARNVANLLSLQPGVTPSGYVAGGRSDQANLTLDGVDVNEQQTGEAFTPVLRVSPDTVEEFRVTTTNPNANQGRSSGAQVELVTKSGSNEWHGNLFEYHRNTIFTANDFFNNSTIVDGKSLPRPVLLRNNYGGSLGGPIKKDRFFFFYNYEGRRDARQVTLNRTVPRASLGQGLLKFFADVDGQGNAPLVPVTMTTAQLNAVTGNSNAAVVDINPVTVGILANAAAKYPVNNNRLGDGLNTGGFQFNAALPVKLSAHVVRLDYKLNDKHSGFFRGNYQQDVTANNPQFPDTITPNTWSHPWGFVAAHTWMVSSSKVNNFRYGLTREAFTNQGDSTQNAITFRNVFASNGFGRNFSRTTPVHNLTDDFTWVAENHSLGFGTNIRITRNNRSSFASSFDNGITNQSFYASSGNVLLTPINRALVGLGLPAGSAVASTSSVDMRHAYASLIGRMSQYTANFNFNVDGTPLAANAPVLRSFATEEMDLYAQDIWKIRDNVTLTYGLRYGLSRPVYERNGFQTRPSIGLNDYFLRRVTAAQQGKNYDEPITVNLAGPAHDAPGFYSLDKNNFQPRVALAWSPAFKGGFLGKVFGSEKESTFRGGFAITNDYFGHALAVNFDGNNTLGFNPSTTPSANTYNITDRPAPLITGLGQTIRTLPGITIPTKVTFPQVQPQDFARRIEGSLDTDLVSPINYSWNFTYGRQMPKGFYVEASYIARLARNLLATRDVMQPNNLVDPVSGQDWYTAAKLLEQHRLNRTSVFNIPKIPFFENMYTPGDITDLLFFGSGLTNSQSAYGFMALSSQVPSCNVPALAGCYDSGNDYTFLQDVLDIINPLFFQSQYGALSSFGTVGNSDYHGATLSVRQRLKGLTWDFNYTFSKSIDDASGLQTSGVFGAAFITNALLQRDNRAVSDFDIRHIVNMNSVWDVPVGRGRKFLNSSNKFVDGVLGGWTISTIFRYNSGLPAGTPVDLGGWPTNWNVRSWSVPIREIHESPTRGGATPANLFSDPKAAYNSFRSPNPGETGARNILRYPGFVALDTGVYKSFSLPWSETQKITIKWDTFNLTNTQHLTGNADNTNGLDPQFGSPSASFYNFTAIQGTPRIMQFALRFDF